MNESTSPGEARGYPVEPRKPEKGTKGADKPKNGPDAILKCSSCGTPINLNIATCDNTQCPLYHFGHRRGI